MSLRYKGGIKSATGAVPTAGAYTWGNTTVGKWNMQEATQLIATGYWQTPPTVSGAPTIGTATAGNASATVAYTAPANTGGSAITTYTATSSPGSFTGTGASPITVSGLTNGTAYTFTVTATNVIGVSAASSASNSVSPFLPATSTVEYLVVAGGGGGGNAAVNSYYAGGGGAGGFRTATGFAVASGTPLTVTVGAGGAATAAGSNSVFSSITSAGGGSGGTGGAGGTGGSGGGGTSGGAGTSGQGNAGGGSSATYYLGGGGGAGAAGYNGNGGGANDGYDNY